MASKQSIKPNFPYSSTINVPNILERISATSAITPNTGLPRMEDTGMTVRICHTCGKELPLSSFVKQSACPSGYTNECKLCHNHKDNTIYNPQRMLFHGIQVRVPIPRTNICTVCGATISENHNRQMSRHHYAHDTYDPMKFTVEMCAKCHGKVPREVNSHV